MNKQLTPDQAWQDFWRWIKTTPEWTQIPRKEKQYLYKAESHWRRGRLGSERIKALLSRHANGRYHFEERVVLSEWLAQNLP